MATTPKFAMASKLPRDGSPATFESIENEFERVYRALNQISGNAGTGGGGSAFDAAEYYLEGTGDPEGVVDAPLGAIFVNPDGEIYQLGAADGATVGDIVGPSSSVDSEVALFSGTTGKLLKRAALSGRPKLASGVLSVAAVDILTETTGFPSDGTKFLAGDGTFKLVTPAWTNVAYDAGNFTGLNSMTWTVGSGDQFTYSYTVIGKIMLLAFDLRATTVGGTADKFLLLKIPGGYTAQSTSSSMITINDNNAGETFGRATTITSGGNLLIGRPDSANWTLCTNLTAVFGLAIFGVN